MYRQIVSIAFCLLLLAQPVGAEFVAELYGGGSFTDNADVIVNSSTGATIRVKDVTFNSSGTIGGRVNYWFDEVRSIGAFGVGLDVFHFRAYADQQRIALTAAVGTTQLTGSTSIQPVDISNVGIGFDLIRFRLHLDKNDQFRNGRIQPYFSVGPALFLTTITDTRNYTPNHQSTSDASLGVKVGTGLNFNVTKNLSLFGEYRFTHFKTDATLQSTTLASQEALKTTIDTHHLVAGIAFHF